MDICGSRHSRKEIGCEGDGKSVAHCVDEDIRNEESEGFEGEDDTANGLAKEGELRPC